MNMKDVVKRLIVAVLAPFALRRLRSRMLPYREGFRYRLGQLLDRYAYSRMLQSLGDNVTIHPSVDIRSPENVVIGSDISINHGSELHGAGGIAIGDGTLISFNVLILSNTRVFRNRGAIGKQPKVKKPVRIGKDVWIGAGTVILPGTRIADHGIIGAGSVVTQDVAEWAIVAGNPARRIGSRLEGEATER